ncbi:PepSY domain-containing protein [Sphingomonas sp. A2-49]|jgi:uncharacterized membrane protein YkoI|uniref:PepSY domain-containing protein n=1 Tax=Sphingomonas sp. A2-49 TaxID=1391375 RepID=UPI0021CE2606|nr:PepSY domain-containing protein [Sphingomonas sp. A2-49]MCU6453362.1 PepSY domain-containing protein [Sphingomonas sp. A2-49]
MRVSIQDVTTSGRLAVAAGLLAISVGSAAYAQPQSSTLSTSARRATKTAGSPSAPKLSIEAIIARVKAQGFTDIEEIEREAEAWEVCAKDAKGQKVELKVNASTGTVESVELEDD